MFQNYICWGKKKSIGALLKHLNLKDFDIRFSVYNSTTRLLIIIINYILSKTVHVWITPCPNPSHCVNFEPGIAKLYSIDDHFKLSETSTLGRIFCAAFWMPFGHPSSSQSRDFSSRFPIVWDNILHLIHGPSKHLLRDDSYTWTWQTLNVTQIEKKTYLLHGYVSSSNAFSSLLGGQSDTVDIPSSSQSYSGKMQICSGLQS